MSETKDQNISSRLYFLVSYLALYSIIFITCETLPVPQTIYVEFHTSQSRNKHISYEG